MKTFLVPLGVFFVSLGSGLAASNIHFVISGTIFSIFGGFIVGVAAFMENE